MKRASKRLRSRLSREEQKAVTRSKIVEMGRKHFFAKGYYATILDQVAEDAGFSRGAIYGHFNDKAELFMAVFDDDLSTHPAERQDDLVSDMVNLPKRVTTTREMFIGQILERGREILRTELEMAAVHDDGIRSYSNLIYQRDLANTIKTIQTAVDREELALHLPVEDFVLLTQIFTIGLVFRRKLMAQELSQQRLRKLAEAFFDSFMIAAPEGSL